MKATLTLSLVFGLLFQSLLFAQVIPSSCDSNDEPEFFTEQAARLTILWLKGAHSPDTVLLQIPDDKLNYIREALYAVHNATELQGYDSISKVYRINPDLHHYYILCDTNTVWARAWSKGNLLTGDEAMDTLLNYLKFELKNYSYDNSKGGAFVDFNTDDLFNITGVFNRFLSFEGISIAKTWDPSGMVESKRLDYYEEGDIRQFTYGYGWGDCLAGCTNWRYWNINVYNDCSVEITGNDPTAPMSITKTDVNPAITVFPNPSTSVVNFKFSLSHSAEARITIFDQAGKQVGLIEQSLPSGEQLIRWNHNDLPAGMYFYNVVINQEISSGKVVITK